MVTGEIIEGDTGPIAVASKFGWLLTGPVKLRGAVPTYTAANLVINVSGATQLPGDDNHALTDALRKFWDLESLGIIETTEEKEKEFIEDIKFSSPRYEVGLPWKDGERDLVTRDLGLCTSRLKSLVNRLKNDPELLFEYNHIIEDQGPVV